MDIYLAIRLNGAENARDKNILGYIQKTLVPHLQEEVVIRDRLGKAGRCKNPKKHAIIQL